MYGTAGDLTSAYIPAEFANNATNFLAFNDDAQGGAHVGGGSVVTGPIDLTAVSGPIFLEFDYFFLNADYQGADETAKILVSTDGTNFTEVYDVPGAADWNTGLAFMDQYAGETIWLTFAYDDGAGWNFIFGFDNVTLVDEPVNAVRRSYTMTVNGGSTFTQALAGVEYPVQGVIINSGYEAINTFDITVGSDVYSFDGFDIPLGGAARYEVPTRHTIGDAFEVISVSISNVNGDMTADENVADNSANITFNPVSGVNEYKAAVVEEATGTWCTWCPRGTVYLDEMSKRFGHNFVGIAVHNGDPMALAAYDSGLTSTPGFSGFPSVVFNRRQILDPADIVAPSISDMQSMPVAAITVGGAMDNGLLSTSIELNFMQDVAAANHRVLIVLSEDGVTGDGPGWNQVSGAYSGGGNGPMGGFEFLPASVPSEVWPYDHVGRALIGNYNGVSGEVVGSYAIGDVESYIFPDFFMNGDWNQDKMHIIGILMDASGAIVNAVSTSFNDAIANGISVSTEDLDLASLEVYPNPVEDNATIVLGLEDSKDVNVTLINSLGQKVSSQSYGTLNGNQTLSYDFSGVNTGMYFLNIALDNKVISKRVTKQ